MTQSATNPNPTCSEPPVADLVTLSLGGGVQSTCLSLMADAGLIYEGAKPEVAYFADTGWEPAYVYETVAAVKERVSFDVETVGLGRHLGQDVADGVQPNGNRFIPDPGVHRRRRHVGAAVHEAV